MEDELEDLGIVVATVIQIITIPHQILNRIYEFVVTLLFAIRLLIGN